MAGVDEGDIDLLDFFSDGPSNAPAEHEHHAHVNEKAIQAASGKPPISRTTNAKYGSARPTTSVVQNGAHLDGPSSRSCVPDSKPTRKHPPADFMEQYSGLRVRNRLLSIEDMRIRMKGRVVHRLSALRIVSPQKLESQDPLDAWATIGVLVSKSQRRQAANGGSYSVWTLSDLDSRENDISVFLFQDALSSFWTVCEGTLLAVVGAKVLPPKGNGEKKLAVSVDTSWQVLKVGMAMDYGLCKGKRKDGKACTMPVDKAKGGFCEFHVVAAFNRAQRQAQDSARKKPQESNMSRMRSMLQVGPAQARMNTPMAVRNIPTPRKPAKTLTDIMGAGARRREEVGVVARLGAASSGPVGIRTQAEAKALRPTSIRAAGRTTILCTGKSLSNASGVPSAPIKSAVCGEQEMKQNAQEDLLGLSWSYGGAGTEKPKNDIKFSRTTTPSASATDKEGVGAGRITGKRPRGASIRDGEGGHSLDARPPAVPHPAGYCDGSVPVPAQSSIFLELANKFNVRADGTMSKESGRELEIAKMRRSQALVVAKARARGVTLRPADSSSAMLGQPCAQAISTGKKPILGSNRITALGSKIASGSSRGSSDPLSKKIKTMSAVEKEVLLRRVSKYAGLAEEERANEADKHMQRLEQREAMADKAEEVKHMSVYVFDCVECKKRRTFFSQHCKKLDHEQKRVKAALRFFECTNCRKRRSCTERMPQTGCESCGTHNAWKRCGARPGRGPADGARDHRFVSAMSEWTDQRDLSLSAPDFR